MADTQYRIETEYSSFGCRSNNLNSLIKKVELYNTFRQGIKAKPRIIEIKTGYIVYD